MKKKIFCIITVDNYLNSILKRNLEIFDKINKNFEKFYIVRLNNLLLFKKNPIKNEKVKLKVPKNFEVKILNNIFEFNNFFNDKDAVCINEIGKDPRYYKIYYLLKKYNLKQILITNFGHVGQATGLDFNLKYWYKPSNLFIKGTYYLFRILNILNIFPKIEILFESDKNIIKAIKNGLSCKFERTFPFFKIAYFRNIQLVNSSSFALYNKYKKNKIKNKIVFADSYYFSKDRLLVDFDANKKNEKIYLKKLNLFLEKLSKITGYKVIICPHPKYKVGKKFSSNFHISRRRTIEEISECKIFIFTASSTVLDALLLKKKMININSKYLGDYFNNYGTKYVKKLNILSVNIDKEFSLKLSDLKYSLKYYEKYIKEKLIPDGRNEPTLKIINTVKKHFKF
tara:strand:+ start:434 stop:1627 length:1194 start_codon:yes stop_codon:yes gene_type:complete